MIIRMCYAAAALIAACAILLADSGVLLPTDERQPNPAVLSLEEMAIDVVIDQLDARVAIRQVYANHTAKILEGNYTFALSSTSLISDFAIWDDVTRIPGVILERRRAEELYQDIRMQALDPGLLQMGESGSDEARRGADFTARVAPIPPWGNKRIELEYHERIPVDQLKGFFSIPLRPSAYRAQTAGKFSIRVDLLSEHALANVALRGKSYAAKIVEQTPHRARLEFDGRAVPLAEDFALEFSYAAPQAPALAVTTHREAGDAGFFKAATLLASPATPAALSPRTVIALFDASLSMQWEKLDSSYQALEKLLTGLRPVDRFNVLVFNSEVKSVTPAPVAAEPSAVASALQQVRQTRLRGATNLQAAIAAALAQTGPNRYIVLLGDGSATAGTIANAQLASWYDAAWKAIAPADRPATFVFATGDDANVSLLKLLARNAGVLEHVRSSEPVEFKLNAFLSKVGRKPAEGLTLSATPAVGLVYPLEDTVFAGSVAAWVGTYGAPVRTTFQAAGASAAVNLPAANAEHPGLPREWAKARVDALLEKIERDGEDQASVDEIIRLARKYKFVTPYTSFLAAPRALLRPRLIRPGDPVLRVKTDRAITSVTAVFPFGLVKKLRYLAGEDTWQTRFLAPVDMQDGTYHVRLILRDREGRTFRESKTFVIASQPPVVRVHLDKARYRPGETVHLNVAASDTARTIVARLAGAPSAYLRWNPNRNGNTGELTVPGHLAAGKYRITVTAEDFAHNIGTGEAQLEIVP